MSLNSHFNFLPNDLPSGQFNRKDGFLFDKEAILQYIITKKTEYAKKLKEYERQKHIEDNETAENNALEEHKKLLKFINNEKNIITTSIGSKMSELTGIDRVTSYVANQTTEMQYLNL